MAAEGKLVPGRHPLTRKTPLGLADLPFYGHQVSRVANSRNRCGVCVEG